MNPNEPSSREGANVKASLVKAATCLALAIGIVAFLFWFSGRERPVPESKKPALIVTPPLTNAEKDAFFHSKIDPILAKNQAANEESLQKFKEDMHTEFDGYRARVLVFIEDITGLGNKSKILWESAKEIGSEDKKKVERHVTEKFNTDVVSAEQIRTSLESRVRVFRHDIEANRNEMLADIDAAVSSDPRFAVSDFSLSKEFLVNLDAEIKTISTQAGKEGVVIGGMSFLATVAVEESIRYLTTAIYIRAATAIGGSMAAAAATASGATAAGAAAGGGTGTLAGPVGVAVGVGVGLIFGGVTDWIMTNRLEKKLNEQCSGFLTSTELSITTDADGLVAQLRRALQEIDKCKAPILRKQLGIVP